MIMRFRPANISLINRRLYLPRLLLTLSSIEKNDHRILTGHYISISGWPVNRSERPEIPASSCDADLSVLIRVLIGEFSGGVQDL
jgi:hypothetical protein